MKNKIIKVKELIKNSEAMDQDEKKSFEEMIPNMNECQIDNLTDILEEEVEWLKKIADNHREKRDKIKEEYGV